MVKSVLEQLEELLFDDPKEVYFRIRARKAGLRGSLPVIEPRLSGRVGKVDLPGDDFFGSGQDPHDTQPGRPQSQDLEQAKLKSFTLELPPSSTIQTATYWPDREYLTVSFKSGHTYSYDDVPFKVVVAWRMAPSAGSFFYYNIRTSFKYQKI